MFRASVVLADNTIKNRSWFTVLKIRVFVVLGSDNQPFANDVEIVRVDLGDIVNRCRPEPLDLHARSHWLVLEVAVHVQAIDV